MDREHMEAERDKCVAGIQNALQMIESLKAQAARLQGKLEVYNALLADGDADEPEEECEP